MYDSVLVPTDGSPGTEGAVVRALDLAETADATLHVLYVIDTRDEPPGVDEADRDEAHEQLRARGEVATTQIEALAHELDLDTAREVTEGVPHRAILEYAQSRGIDAIVMGTRGQTEPGGHHLGSTTERVLLGADVPVLTVRVDEAASPPEPGYGMYDRVVIATDGSDTAERAAEQGLTVAERYGADVRVVYVVDSTTYGLEDAPRSIVGLLREGGETALEEFAAEARGRNLPVSTSMLRGTPEDAILKYADGAGCDVIVVGTRGQTSADDRFLGSTTARIVRRSNIPVLAVS